MSAVDERGSYEARTGCMLIFKQFILLFNKLRVLQQVKLESDSSLFTCRAFDNLS